MERYAHIRDADLLGPFLGQRIVEITQHDQDEWEETRESYFCLHFENGFTLRVPVGDSGFDILDPSEPNA